MHTDNRLALGNVFRHLLLIGLIALTCFSAEASEPLLNLIEMRGSLYEQRNEKFEEVKTLSDGWNSVRVGGKAKTELFKKSPEKLGEAHSVFTAGNRLLLTLSNGTSFKHSVSKEKTGLYNLTGAAHFLINGSTEKQPFIIKVNDLRIETLKLHLFYEDIGGTSRITVIEGSASVTLPVKRAKPVPKKKAKPDPKKPVAKGTAAAKEEIKPAAVVEEIVLETLKLEPQDRLILEKGGYRIEKKVDLKKYQILISSTIPGFEMPGPYRSAGKGEFKGDFIQIKRFGKSSQIKYSPTLLMEGDEITTSDDQTAVLYLTQKDVVRLSQKSSFSINAYKFDKQSLTSILSFSGKIRARIAKRKKRSNIRFKTATAVIGIKGTVFESTASADLTAVETVQGTVGVADPDGQGEVDVKAGEMTSVASGAQPTKPAPIPADRWQQLQNGLIPIAAGLAVPLTELRILTPIEGQIYITPVLNFETEPVDAPVIVLLDGKPLIAESGDAPFHLAEGSHQLLVKGAAEGGVAKTVIFTIDKTVPTLSPVSQLDGFILRQFMPLNLIWSEPLASLSVTFNNVALATTLAADGLNTNIDSTPLFANPAGGNLVNLVFEVNDRPGNTARFVQQLQIKFKPTTPPLISIDGGKQLMHMREAKIISALSDRDIEQWTVKLDQKPLTLQPSAQTTVQPATDKKKFTIPASHFSQLTEGQHVLEISGIDDFGLVGKQVLTLKVDRTPPILQQPLALLNPIQVINESRLLTFSNLVVKESESLVLSWSEPIASNSLTLSGTGIKLPLAPMTDPKSFRLDAAQIKLILASTKTSPVTLEAKDAAGNITQMQGRVQYLPKPVSPPEISVQTRSGVAALKQITGFRIKSDREIFQWKFQLNGKEIAIPPASSTTPVADRMQFELKQEIFPELPDGRHELHVSGTDRFNLNGTGKLAFNLDSKGPEVAGLSIPVKVSSIKLGANEVLELKWSEALAAVEATLEDKPWALVLSSDMTVVLIKGDPAMLSYEPKSFNLKATDQVGNFTQLSGSVALKKPRKMALRDSYEETILKTTQTSIDAIFLIDRSEFRLSEAEPVFKTTSNRLLEDVKYKPKPRSEFLNDLDEPLFNSQ